MRQRRQCVGTHSKSDGLDWHACWPSTVSVCSFLFLSNSQLSFLLPPASVLVQGTQTLILRKHRLNSHTHIGPDTHLSKHGGWRDRRGWGLSGWGALGFISRGMLPVSKGTHFTHSYKQLGTAKTPHGLPNSILAPCLLLPTQFFFT